MQYMEPAEYAGFYLQTTQDISFFRDLSDNFRSLPHFGESVKADFMVWPVEACHQSHPRSHRHDAFMSSISSV